MKSVGLGGTLGATSTQRAAHVRSVARLAPSTQRVTHGTAAPSEVLVGLSSALRAKGLSIMKVQRRTTHRGTQEQSGATAQVQSLDSKRLDWRKIGSCP